MTSLIPQITPLNSSVTVEGPYAYTVGNGGSAWAGNSTMNNVTEDNGDHNVKIGIFADNYEDNNLNGWTTTGGTHTVSNGVYKQQTAAVEWVTARATDFTYTSSASILAKVNVTDGGTYLDESLGWGDSTWNSATALFAGRRDYWNQWELRRNDVTDDSDTLSRTLNEWSNVRLCKQSNGYEYSSSFDSIVLNTLNVPAESQYPYLLGSSYLVQYWNDVRIVPLDSNNNIVTTGNLTTWHDAGAGNEIYQIDVNAITPQNTNYTVWYRQNGTGQFVQVGGVYTDSNTIALSPGYQNTDVRIVLNGNQTATPVLIYITFYT